MDHRHVESELSALAADLTSRQPRLLQSWRARAKDDPQVTTANALSRSEFDDHIPALLNSLANRWRTRSAQTADGDRDKEVINGASHGLQRWRQGYRLREVAREWAHFQLVLVDYLEQYSAERPQLNGETMRFARRTLAEMCSTGVSESVAQYFELEQSEAAGSVRDLQQTVEHVRMVEQQRAELWRQAAHDLRGHTQVIASATAGLTLPGVPEGSRERFSVLLQRSMAALHAMLNDTINLARLQAGYEKLEVAPFDAAVLLREMCEDVQSDAEARGLYLRTSGPESLEVTGDAVKVRRIVQNLLFNALKYTTQGGVTVSWGDSREDDPARWMLTLQDTGPGFATGPRVPIVAALKEATREAHEIERKAGIEVTPPGAPPPPMPAAVVPAVSYERGEGVGLSIVKRLSELLDAGIELESEAGSGTVIRVIFPRSYDGRPA